MTKRKIKEWEGSEWLSGQFPSPAAMSSSSGSVSSCDYCHGRFGYFWWTSGGRKSCQFCGYQIHSRCSSSLPNDNGRKTRICRRCLKYKYNSSKLLIEGDEFISYTGRLPSACYLCLSEVECCLLLRVDPSDVEEKIPLGDIISVQRGFSHAGHMRAASLYDPLRCFSINTNTADGYKTYDLKAESLSHCEKWITSLNTALEVYNKLKEQQRLRQTTTFNKKERESTKTSPSPSSRSPTTTTTTTTSSSSSSSVSREEESRRQRRKMRDSPEVVIGDGKSLEIYEEDDMVVVDVTSDSGTNSSREATPTSESGDSKHSPVVLQRSHYKIRTFNAPHRSKTSKNSSRNERLTATVTSTKSLPDWRTESSSSHGLPYKGKKNPLASNCACHAYAIESPQDFLFPFSSKRNVPNDPFQTCCERCRGKCRIAHDLRAF